MCARDPAGKITFKGDFCSVDKQPGSCGDSVWLAATFAALAVIPILFLVQIAFIVAFGVLLDTVVVRALLVPAASYDIGRAIWWPSPFRKE